MSTRTMVGMLVGLGAALALGALAWVTWGGGGAGDGSPAPGGGRGVVSPSLTGDGDGPGAGSEIDSATASLPSEVELLTPPDAGTAAAIDEGPSDGAPDAEPTPQLTGRVLVPGGEPVFGARVHFVPSYATAQELGLSVQRLTLEVRERLPAAVTDEQGRFVLDAPHVAVGESLGRAAMYARMFPPEIVAGAPGLTWESRPLPDYDGTGQDLGDIVLRPAATLLGRVLDPLGRPLPDTVVAPFPWMPADHAPYAPPGSSGRAWDFWRVATDARGRFVLDRVAPGTGRVALAHPLYRARETDELSLGPGATLDLGDLPLEEGDVLAGVVLDGARVPVADALLRLTLDEGGGHELRQARRLREMLTSSALEARSAADGSFLFTGLSAVTGDLRVTAPGFDRQYLPNVAIGRTDVVVILDRGLWVVVDVRDADGAALTAEAASVEARSWSGRGPREGGAREVRTGEAAREMLAEGGLSDIPCTALVALPPEGDLELVVTAPGCAARRERLVRDDFASFDRHAVALQPEARVSGRVVDAAGEPVAGATVQARPGSIEALAAGKPPPRVPGQPPPLPPDDGDPRLPAEADTDAAGLFLLGGLAHGTWTLGATAEGHVASALQEVTAAVGGRVQDVELVLADGGTLLARVFAPDGSRPRGVRVSVWVRQPDGNATDWRHVETDAAGDARIAALPAGLWQVRADPGALLEAEVAVGRVTELVVPLRDVPRLFGQVRETGSGRGVPDARVLNFQKVTRDGEHLRFSLGGDALTDDQGRYEIEGRWPMTGTVVAQLAGGGRSEPVDVAVGWDEARQLDLWVPPGVVRGRVVDAASGAGVAGAWVRAARAGAETVPEYGTPRLPTDVEGRFELRGLAAGAHDLTWNAEGYARGEGVQVVLAEGEVRGGLELPLGHGGSLRVQVSHADGTPAANGTEVTVLQGGTGRYLADGETLEGTAAIPSLPAGELEVVVGEFMLSFLMPDAPVALVRVPVTLTDGEDKLVEVVLGP